MAGHPTDPQVFYFGHCAGGVWRTGDGGRFWSNISDGFFHTGSVGALALSDADPNVLYAGMGESNIRGNVSHGDGVYASTDGGTSWRHLGLRQTRHIAKVRVHPRNPDGPDNAVRRLMPGWHLPPSGRNRAVVDSAKAAPGASKARLSSETARCFFIMSSTSIDDDNQPAAGRDVP